MHDRVGSCLVTSGVKKYGTCGSPVTGDQYDYFLTTVNVYLKYNVTYALYEAGYVPSDTINYTSSGIISAIKFAFDATPILSCNKGAIQEVRLCLTKDFKLQDCFGYTNCPENVTLPAFKFRDTKKTRVSLDTFYNILSS
ncbi:ribonuclease 2-like [Bidens hawaiensis]|uniref:ribonuclease 2-like n=1 Tax=Bidens hawaiensis TaxID=980011 RepID=UPI004049B98D